MSKRLINGNAIVGLSVCTKELLDRINSMPELWTDDDMDGGWVAHRDKGNWIRVEDELVSCKCSNCGHEFNLYEDDVYGYRYCPACGAEMETEENE